MLSHLGALGDGVPGKSRLKWESLQTCVWRLSTIFNGCPAVTYSPTPSRVQYHRRCGS
jgi:hypothetical protein